MNNRFEFLYDSGLCGAEDEISYDRFIIFLEQAIDHYNTDDCYVNDDGEVWPHIYQDENGGLISTEHFEPDLYLFDTVLKRIIKLQIEGYDDDKIFNIEMFDTTFQSLLDYFGDDMIILEKLTLLQFNFQTKNVELVKYCYKLIFENAEAYELNQLLDSIKDKQKEEWYNYDIENL